jgi:hypothetical protein
LATTEDAAGDPDPVWQDSGGGEDVSDDLKAAARKNGGEVNRRRDKSAAR